MHLKKRRRAVEEPVTSENRTPLLFDVSDSVMLDKENIITPQGLHGGIRPLMKRRPLAALNDVSAININKKKQMSEVGKPQHSTNVDMAPMRQFVPNTPLRDVSARNIVRDKLIKNQSNHSTPNSHSAELRKSRLKNTLRKGMSDETPKSILSDVFNSIGSSSTNGEKTAMKKCFQNTPQILNFDEPPLHANPSDNLEEAEYARIRGIVDESPDLYEHDGRLA
ncbi:hypothetical protein DCAR_0727783 [Daucus carota subsp. sativus]|uniref:Uncharacterized protein n=1 Tax=Daucus carota subsp. sativus TaxID=79200 RepID=A0A164T3G8_DAUCS|nr:hypothetical protein DCAR_0727783 [Daucus carota subsp. sativus]